LFIFLFKNKYFYGIFLVVAISVDSQFTHLGTIYIYCFKHILFVFHLAWINTPREQGGLGKIQIPLLSDLTHQISKDYGVYLQDVGHALRYELRYVLL
jgi:alkyl hydroperoxide reductase subunit AhpC